MKTLILYKSVSGAAKDYAKWLAEELKNSEFYSIDKFNEKELSAYDLFIIISRTFMGKIAAKEFLEKNWNVLESKKVILVAVGYFKEEAKESIVSYNEISETIRNKLVGYVKLPGRINSKKLSLGQKFLTKLIRAKDYDNVERRNISRIISIVKGINS